MLCPTAADLFEKFAEVTQELFEATDNLAMLDGQHEAFAEAKKHVEHVSAKCRTARGTLEQHWMEHGCRVRRRIAHPC